MRALADRFGSVLVLEVWLGADPAGTTFRIQGDKLLEVNVFSPGGLGSAERVTGTDFTRTVVDALARKVSHLRDYEGHFENRQLATM